MDPIYYYLFGAAAVFFLGLAWFLRVKGRKELAEQAAQLATAEPSFSRPANPEMLKLQLQAYERLMILAERIGLEQLMGRFNGKDVPLSTYQHQLVQAIKTEFEYNVSQQLYVSATAWDGVKNLKEQHIFIINQLAAMLPAQATGLDLGKKLTELLAQEDYVPLQTIVTNLLSKEARQLMYA